ncbi:tail fiber domain-containing protein ['Paenibacillus yunnanensis' Narsing Rao et al. 2020]|uniref:tail fiber domain-containing protein n=1 Tax=Paenibacillus tengchongensis TaxID=2608684 RepID=UPI00124CA321|nr:tail fiber domain-containing protein [Paenibacillus tengchongensis]
MPNDIKRMNYFNGLLLKEEDLKLDQSYHQRLQRLHNRYFHDWGVVAGLKVEPSEKDPTKVTIAPGIAINRVLDPENNEEIGQEIVVGADHPSLHLDLAGYSTSDQIYITVSYSELLTDTDADKGGTNNIHVWEYPVIKTSSKKPEEPSKDILIARVVLTHRQDGTMAVENTYTTDVDGSPLVRKAVGGATLQAGKLIIGKEAGPSQPYFSSSETGIGDDTSTLYIHAEKSEFTGPVHTAALTVSGQLEVDGSFAVTAGGEETLKVSAGGDIELAGPVHVTGPLQAAGGLDVSGGQAVLDVPQVVISGNMITLNKNDAGPPNSGIEISRGNRPNAKLVWDEDAAAWKIGTENQADQSGSGMHKIAYGADWERLHGGASADGLHKHSGLYDSKGAPALSTDTDSNVVIENKLTVDKTLIATGSGLEIKRGETKPNAKLAWNEETGTWQIGASPGEMTDIPDGKRWEELTGGSHNADDLHTHSQFHNEDRSLLALEIGADGNVHIPHELMVGETLTVNKLVVKEEEVVVRKVEQEVADSFLTVNKAENEAAADDKGGLEVYRGNGKPKARLEWSENERKWRIGVTGSMSDIPYGNKWDALTNGTVADTSHKHSVLGTPSGGAVLTVNDQGKVTASGDAEVAGKLLAGGEAELQGNLKVGGSATIDGNLTVTGSTTFINKSELAVTSNRIELNKFEGSSGSLLKRSSIEVYRGKQNPSAKLVWDEDELRWKLGLGDELSNIAYGSNWDALTGGVSSDADGLHRHNSLSDGEGNTALRTTDDGDIEVVNSAEIQGTLTVNNGADITGGLAVEGQLTVDGNLLVRGTTTTVSREDLVVESNMIEINKFTGGEPPVNESGIEVFRGESQPGARLVWNESERKWKVGIGTSLETIASGSAWDKLTQAGNADSLHIHSQLYNPQTDILALSASAEGDVDIHHDLTIGGGATIAGSLEVRGAEVNLQSDKLTAASSVITLNKDGAAAVSATGGAVEIYRGSAGAAAQIAWQEDKDQWKLGLAGAADGLAVDTAGNINASGSLQAAGGVFTGTISAAGASLTGNLIVGEGLEVPQGTESDAQIKWVKDRWKLGTVNKTVLSLTRSGRMGIGTDNPTEVLDVAGKAVFRTEAEFAGATSFSGKLTAHKEAVFEDQVSFTKPVKAADLAVSGSLEITGKLLAGKLEASRGLDSEGKPLANASIYWDNAKQAWFYGNGVTLAELGSGKDSQNKLYDAVGKGIAVFADAEGKVGIGTNTPLAALDVRVAADTTAFSVTKAGNVGVGTATPAAKLDVRGEAAVTKLNVQGDAAVTGTLNAASAVVSKDLTVNGNLTVNGDVVTVNTATLEIEDNIIRVNKYSPQATPVVKNGGLEVFRGGTAPAAQLVWDESADQWLAGASDALKAIEYKGHTHPEIAGLSEVFTIDAGKVGIGTAAPAATLDVGGTARISGKLTATEAAVSSLLSGKDAAFTGTLSGKDIAVSGMLTTMDASVTGTLTAKDSAVTGKLTAKDAVISGSLAVGQGLSVERGTDPKAQILWDEAADEWQLGVAGNMKQLSYNGHTHQELTVLSGALKVVSGNVGIGTANPAVKLDVSGNAAVSGKISAAEAAVTGTLTAKDISAGGTVTAANASISAALSAKDAQVTGKLTAKDAVISGSLAVAQGISVERGTDPKAQILWDEAADEWQLGVAGSMKSLSYSGHTHQELAELSGALRIVSGNVGIGTASPSAKLDVGGSVAVSGKLTAAEAAVSSLLSGKDAAFTGALSAKDAAVTGTLTVKDGSVSGTLTAPNAAVTAKLTAKDVAVSGSLEVSQGLTVSRDSDPKAQLLWDEGLDAWQAGIAGSLKPLAYSDHTHAELSKLSAALTVDDTGNVGIGKPAADDYKLDVDGNMRAKNFAQTSSRTFKDNITALPVKKAVELLGKLKPVTFSYKADNGKQQNIGFIAEEVPQIFATSDQKSVVLMDIIAVLTTVVQKQQKDAEGMHKQLKALQSQVAALTGA